jgi:hypothetical protein
MPKVAFKQADVARLVRGAIDGGLPAGTFAIQLVNGLPTIMPIDQPVARTKVEPDEDAAALAAIAELTQRYG